MSKAIDNKQDDWFALVPHLTHDFRSPLVSTRLEAQTLEKWLPELIKGYRLAVEHQLMEGSIHPRQLSMREADGGSIGDNMTKLLGFLEVLDGGASALTEGLSTVDLRSIQSYLDDVLAQYPFESDADRHDIQRKGNVDFDVRCDAFFVESLLFQLLEIVYEAMKTSGDGTITLSTQTESADNQLSIKLSAPGLSERQLSYFFDRFAAKQGEAYMPGLGFCRLALRQLGGDIAARIVEGEDSEIVVVFPQ